MDIKVSTVDGRVPVTIVHVDDDIDSSTSEAFETKVDELPLVLEANGEVSSPPRGTGMILGLYDDLS